VLQLEYDGNLGAYRLMASRVLDEAKAHFQRILDLAEKRLQTAEGANDRK